MSKPRSIELSDQEAGVRAALVWKPGTGWWVLAPDFGIDKLRLDVPHLGMGDDARSRALDALAARGHQLTRAAARMRT